MPLIKPTKQNIDSMFQLNNYAFNKAFDKNRYDSYQILAQNSDTFGYQHDGIVTNQLMSIKRSANIFDTKLPMAGIGYVASYPEARGQGGIKNLFIEVLESMYQQNFVLSYLAPFSQTFYRKFGYENALWQKQYTFDVQTWPFLNKVDKGTFQRFTLNEAKEMASFKQLHSKLLASKHGNTLREDWWWDYLAIKKPNYQVAILLDEDNQPKGYMMYEMNQSFDIVELAYANHHDLCQLLEFARRHTATFQQFTYTGPKVEDITYCFTDNQFINVAIKPYMMARIVDFQKYFDLIKEKINWKYNLSIQITDEQCPWNNHTFHLSQEKCSIDDNKEADLKASIATISAIFTGALSLQEAYQQELIIGKDDIIRQINIPQIDLSLSDYF